jgi:hypothetical protein
VEEIEVDHTFIAGSIRALLVPDPDPEDEPWIGDRFCSLTGEGSCTAKRSVVRKADVRGKFTAELVAQTYPRVDIGESRSNSALGILLAVEVHLELRLCDQPLCKQQIIGARYSGCQVTSVTEVERWLQLKEVRCESLDAYRTPDTLRA